MASPEDEVTFPLREAYERYRKLVHLETSAAMSVHWGGCDPDGARSLDLKWPYDPLTEDDWKFWGRGQDSREAQGVDGSGRPPDAVPVPPVPSSRGGSPPRGAEAEQRPEIGASQDLLDGQGRNPGPPGPGVPRTSRTPSSPGSSGGRADDAGPRERAPSGEAPEGRASPPNPFSPKGCTAPWGTEGESEGAEPDLAVRREMEMGSAVRPASPDAGRGDESIAGAVPPGAEAGDGHGGSLRLGSRRIPGRGSSDRDDAEGFVGGQGVRDSRGPMAATESVAGAEGREGRDAAYPPTVRLAPVGGSGGASSSDKPVPSGLKAEGISDDLSLADLVKGVLASADDEGCDSPGELDPDKGVNRPAASSDKPGKRAGRGKSADGSRGAGAAPSYSNGVWTGGLWVRNWSGTSRAPHIHPELWAYFRLERRRLSYPSSVR